MGGDLPHKGCADPVRTISVIPGKGPIPSRRYRASRAATATPADMGTLDAVAELVDFALGLGGGELAPSTRHASTRPREQT